MRRTQPQTLDTQQLQNAVELRQQLCTLRRIAKAVGVPLSTVGRVMKDLGLGRHRNLDPMLPLQPYQWEKPVDIIYNAERFMQTLCRECAYGMACQTSDERKRWRPRYVCLYNGGRCHMALSGLSPQQRILALFAECPGGKTQLGNGNSSIVALRLA